MHRWTPDLLNKRRGGFLSNQKIIHVHACGSSACAPTKNAIPHSCCTACPYGFTTTIGAMLPPCNTVLTWAIAYNALRNADDNLWCYDLKALVSGVRSVYGPSWLRRPLRQHLFRQYCRVIKQQTWSIRITPLNTPYAQNTFKLV